MSGSARSVIKPVFREASLDGLRGLAALVVLFHHQLLTAPTLAWPYVHPQPASAGTASWWLTYTPLHLGWDGADAVIVFFVLSGYVLTLASVRVDSWPRWASYYVRRLLRLYVPVVASLIFALVLVALIHRRPYPGMTFWTDAQIVPGHGVRSAAHDALLLRGVGPLDTPLWSLQYEVLFSLLLPAYIALGRHLPLPTLQIAVLLGLTAYGAKIGSLPVEYLPIFGVGVVMANHRDALARAADKITRRGWWVLLVISLLLLSGYWMTYATVRSTHLLDAAAAADAGIVLGAGLLVFIFSAWTAARDFGTSRTLQWLGQRSFSLYLIHCPIIATAAFAWAPHLGTLERLVICTPLCLFAADLFFRYVEAPGHLLAQVAGRWTSGGTGVGATRVARHAAAG